MHNIRQITFFILWIIFSSIVLLHTYCTVFSKHCYVNVNVNGKVHTLYRAEHFLGNDRYSGSIITDKNRLTLSEMDLYFFEPTRYTEYPKAEASSDGIFKLDELRRRFKLEDVRMPLNPVKLFSTYMIPVSIIFVSILALLSLFPMPEGFFESPFVKALWWGPMWIFPFILYILFGIPAKIIDNCPKYFGT